MPPPAPPSSQYPSLAQLALPSHVLSHVVGARGGKGGEGGGCGTLGGEGGMNGEASQSTYAAPVAQLEGVDSGHSSGYKT